MAVYIDKHSKRVHKKRARLLQELHVEGEKRHVVDAGGGDDTGTVQLFRYIHRLRVHLKSVFVAPLTAKNRAVQAHQRRYFQVYATAAYASVRFYVKLHVIKRELQGRM